MSTKPVALRESQPATKPATVVPIPTTTQNISKLIQQYGCGPVQFSGTDNALMNAISFLTISSIPPLRMLG